MRKFATDLRFIVMIGCGLVVLAGCPPIGAQLPPPINVAAGLQAEFIAGGLPQISAITTAEDGRVFFIEQDTGRVRVIKNGVLLATPFAEVPVNTYNERGLLGIALHTRFRDNGRVYVFYSRSDTGVISDRHDAIVDNRVVYFESQRYSDVASGGELFVASFPISDSGARIGGRLAFAPDRTLLVALGDLTSADLVQHPTALFGKVLRYNDDGSIPEDNPVADSPVYASGLRHPVGLNFDPDSGAAFLIERGARGRHEINRIAAGKNYGYPAVTGVADTTTELEFAAQHANYTDPLLDTAGQRATLAGVAFNPSTKYGNHERLRLFYGDATNRRIRSLKLTADRTGAAGTSTFATGFGAPITDLTFTPAGTLYVARQDAVLRIVLVEAD